MKHGVGRDIPIPDPVLVPLQRQLPALFLLRQNRVGLFHGADLHIDLFGHPGKRIKQLSHFQRSRSEKPFFHPDIELSFPDRFSSFRQLPQRRDDPAEAPEKQQQRKQNDDGRPRQCHRQLNRRRKRAAPGSLPKIITCQQQGRQYDQQQSANKQLRPQGLHLIAIPVPYSDPLKQILLVTIIQSAP